MSRRREVPTGEVVLSALVVVPVVLLIAGCAAPSAPAPAAAGGRPERKLPVLTVPSSARPLHIAVRLPGDAEFDPGASWRLVEKLVEEGKPGQGVPVEIARVEAPDGASSGSAVKRSHRLVAVIPPGEGDGLRRFALRRSDDAAAAAFAFRHATERSLELLEGGRTVLVYNHDTMSRKGVAAKYDRANYFHPVHGIDGEVLTDDFPKDHYHHRGIFWAWTSVRTGEGRDRKFESWVPNRFEYRHERWTSRHAGSLAAAIGAETGWIAGGKKIVHEEMLVLVHRVRKGAAGEDSRAIDFELTWTALEGPVALKGAANKGYGGLTFRFAPCKDTVITVSPDGPDGGGRTKKDLVAKRLAGADLAGRLQGAKSTSGAAVFVAPDHPDFPPVWLTRHYGPLCVGWPGLVEGTLEPGRPVTCRYRVWVHRGNPEAETIQAAYDAYTKGLEAEWEGR